MTIVDRFPLATDNNHLFSFYTQCDNNNINADNILQCCSNFHSNQKTIIATRAQTWWELCHLIPNTS